MHLASNAGRPNQPRKMARSLADNRPTLLASCGKTPAPPPASSTTRKRNFRTAGDGGEAPVFLLRSQNCSYSLVSSLQPHASSWLTIALRRPANALRWHRTPSLNSMTYGKLLADAWCTGSGPHRRARPPGPAAGGCPASPATASGHRGRWRVIRPRLAVPWFRQV